MKALTIAIIRLPLSILKLILALFCYLIYCPYITIKTYIALRQQQNAHKHLAEILANIQAERDYEEALHTHFEEDDFEPNNAEEARLYEEWLDEIFDDMNMSHHDAFLEN